MYGESCTSPDLTHAASVFPRHFSRGLYIAGSRPLQAASKAGMKSVISGRGDQFGMAGTVAEYAKQSLKKQGKQTVNYLPGSGRVLVQ